MLIFKIFSQRKLFALLLFLLLAVSLSLTGCSKTPEASADPDDFSAIDYSIEDSWAYYASTI